MNKEQSADDPSVDLICVKNMLNSTISMSYPDVVNSYVQNIAGSGSIRIPEVLVKHDNNMKDYSPVWLTDHHNC